MHHLSCVAHETTRYETLFRQLSDPDCSHEYIKTALDMINCIVNNAPDMNMLVYLELDFERAGFHELLDVSDCLLGLVARTSSHWDFLASLPQHLDV